MTPLLFIIIASTVLLLLVYWVLSTLRNDDAPDNSRKFKFETAPELSFDYSISNHSDIPPDNNELKLSKINESQLVAQWNISEEKWQEKLSAIGYPFTAENITLRVYPTSAGMKSFDIPVKSLQGSHDFFCQPDTAYYVVLGILQTTFVPLIFSNTVIVPREDSAIRH